MRVLFVTAEAVPFAKVGGLADVAGALPVALANQGVDVRVILPKYASVDDRKYSLQRAEDLGEVDVPVDASSRRATFSWTYYPNTAVKVYFVGNDHYFGREGIYTDPGTGDGYKDNGERFIFFMKAVMHAARLLDGELDLIHCHDHQTGLIPAYLKVTYSADRVLSRVASLFTIHNLAYQGLFSPSLMPATGFGPEYFSPLSPFEFWGRINFMKVGIHYADVLNTVSPRYAQEIQMGEEYGFGLQGVLQDRKEDLYGILNGIDDSVWNPETDPLIPYRYSATDLSGKSKNKEALLRRCGFSPDGDGPVIGLISRLTDQKGFDLLEQIVDPLFSLDVRVVVLGTGQKKYQDLLQAIQGKYRLKFRVFLAFDDPLAHLIEAGSDLFLMPSRFEPCGLNQLYSLKYGTVPIVRSTGGLADTVQDLGSEPERATGFKFEAYEPEALLAAVRRALRAYQDRSTWQQLMRRGMQQDFSWAASARQYLELYRKTIRKRRNERST